MKNSKKTIPK